MYIILSSQLPFLFESFGLKVQLTFYSQIRWKVSLAIIYLVKTLMVIFYRVQECEQFYDWDSAENGDSESYNLTHYTHLCKIQGKRYVEGNVKRKCKEEGLQPFCILKLAHNPKKFRVPLKDTH